MILVKVCEAVRFMAWCSGGLAVGVRSSSAAEEVFGRYDNKDGRRFMGGAEEGESRRSGARMRWYVGLPKRCYSLLQQCTLASRGEGESETVGESYTARDANPRNERCYTVQDVQMLQRAGAIVSVGATEARQLLLPQCRK